MNRSPPILFENKTRDVSVIMKCQQEQMTLRALMYRIEDT